MGRIDVRGINDEYILKLDRLASRKKLSRSEYVRCVLQSHVMKSELEETENKYIQLVQLMSEVSEVNAQKLEQIADGVEEIKELLQKGTADEETFCDY